MVRAFSERNDALFAEAGRKVKKSILLRPKQVNQVFDHIEASPMDAFICGDFNDNPMSYTYYRLTRGRKDSFMEAGSGFGSTFSFLWPMLRIDYILFPDFCEAAAHEVIRLPYSDHYPVVAEVKM
jgi:endonuclease/exonuclease/phosphatase family metal-dependent hydrolase